MINKHWFEVKEISCPIINEDSSYSLTDNLHKIKIVTDINSEEIYEDLFRKLGDIYEINE